MRNSGSTSFAGYRKSPLQMYRVLANLHEEHLDALADSIDSCYGQGYVEPKLLRTRARSQFASAISELLTAEHFFLRGFDAQGLDSGKGSERVADLRVKGHGIEALVEVYTPVEWISLDDLDQDVRDAMKNLDEPFEYVWRWDVKQLADFDRSGPQPRLLFLHPEPLNDGLAADNARAQLVHPLFTEVVAGMRGGAAAPLLAESEHPKLNVRLRLEVEQYAPRTDGPARAGVNGGPSLSGYRPEAFFSNVVKKAKRKAAKRQARSDGSALEILVVDVTRAKIDSELGHDVYRQMFLNTLEQTFKRQIPYDLIALCDARSPGHGLRTHFVVREDTRLSDEQVQRLFDVEL
ncbi:MAG: hypothetical protein ACRDF0_06715 [Candidatus Limnocylindria bacterium]